MTLDASGSMAPDGYELSFSWSFVRQPSGSQTELAEAEGTESAPVKSLGRALEIAASTSGVDTVQIAPRRYPMEQTASVEQDLRLVGPDSDAETATIEGWGHLIPAQRAGVPDRARRHSGESEYGDHSWRRRGCEPPRGDMSRLAVRRLRFRTRR